MAAKPATKHSSKLPLMRSVARIKPISVEEKAGIAATERLSGWSPEKGTVTFSFGDKDSSKKTKKDQTFSHFHHVLPPDISQSHTFETVCSPLVRQWLGGHDVDLICYGQTGSGKTYTQFGPPKSMKKALEALGEGGGIGTISPADVVQKCHGLILRTGFAALAAVDAINKRGDSSRAVLHGSMVEMSIMSSSQHASDLLAAKKQCFVDKHHHLEGAVHLPLTDTRSLVTMAAAVETRLTRGTKMNNSSSRSHCVTVFTLHTRDTDNKVRISRFNFFDFMGSERFKGPNAAHGGGSARSTTAGWEGIYANYSLLFLGEAVRAATQRRRAKKNSIQKMGGKGFLNELLSGSLVGHALTAMVTCLSGSERNGAESFLSCKYSKDMAKMQNEPRVQLSTHFDELVAQVEQERAKSAKIAAKGVAGKYQAKRMAEVAGYENTLNILRKELRPAAGGGDVVAKS